MKYLKSINEDNHSPLPWKKSDIIEYINMCFIDILEDNRFESDTDIHGQGSVIRIGISMKTPRPDGNPYIGVWKTNIDELKSINTLILDLYSDIDSAINRVMDKYPISYDIKTNKIGTIYINFKLNKRL